MKIETSRLIPTHNELRNPETVWGFMGDVSSLERAMLGKDKIGIMKIEDKLYVHNGHHRLTAFDRIYGYIDDKFLNIVEYSLDDMLSVNLELGWVTP